VRGEEEVTLWRSLIFRITEVFHFKLFIRYNETAPPKAMMPTVVITKDPFLP
jgi:hypothetical protein